MAVVTVGIDPGPAYSAMVAVTMEGKLWMHHMLPNPQMLELFLDFEHHTADVAIEMIGHYGCGMPAGKDVFETCVWIGRFHQVLLEITDRPHYLLRKTICTHICGSPKAKDGNIRQALIDRYGPVSTREDYIPTGKRGEPLKARQRTVEGPLFGISGDCWSALAVATTYMDAPEKAFVI